MFSRDTDLGVQAGTVKELSPHVCGDPGKCPGPVLAVTPQTSPAGLQAPPNLHPNFPAPGHLQAEWAKPQSPLMLNGPALGRQAWPSSGPSWAGAPGVRPQPGRRASAPPVSPAQPSEGQAVMDG